MMCCDVLCPVVVLKLLVFLFSLCRVLLGEFIEKIFILSWLRPPYRCVILHLRLKLNNGFGISSSYLIAFTQQQTHAIP